MNLIEALKALDEGVCIESPLFYNHTVYVAKREDGEGGYGDAIGSNFTSIFHFIEAANIAHFDDSADNFSVYAKPFLTDDERSFVKNLLGDFIGIVDMLEIQKETDDKYYRLSVWYCHSIDPQICLPVLKGRFGFDGLNSGVGYTPKELGLV